MFTRLIPLVLLVTLWTSVAWADDALEVKKVVRAYLDAEEKWDPKAFANFWADDGRLVRGRKEEPEESDKFEVVLNRNAIDGYWALSIDDVAQTPRTYSNVNVAVNGDEATLRLKWRSQHNANEYVIWGQVFQLRRLAGGWKIYYSRSWPIEEKAGNTVTHFNAQTYKTLDAMADEALGKYEAVKTAGGKTLQDARSKAVVAMLTAYRVKEMFQLYKESMSANAPASQWETRGRLALSAGEVGESWAAYLKAIELDPKADVPKAVRDRARGELFGDGASGERT